MKYLLLLNICLLQHVHPIHVKIHPESWGKYTEVHTCDEQSDCHLTDIILQLQLNTKKEKVGTIFKTK